MVALELEQHLERKAFLLVQIKRLPLWCGEFEVRVLISAPSRANFKFKNHTRFIELLVSLMIPKSVQSLPNNLTYFGIGTLAAYIGHFGSEPLHAKATKRLRLISDSQFCAHM